MAYWSSVSKTRKALKGVPVSAKCVLIARNGKLLMLRKCNGLYDLPGGKVERREDMFEALTREIREETGLKITKFDFLASWIKEQDGLGPRLMIVFRARLKKAPRDIDIQLSEEHDWGAFLSPKKALNLPMQAGYKNAIALSSQRKLTV